MRLVFVHGMRQEGRAPDVLVADWETSLRNSWTALGIEAPDYELLMPYYGDELDTLTEEVRGPGGNVVERGGGPGNDTPFTDLESEMVLQMAKEAGASEADLRAELDQAVLERGPLNWEWVQAAARWLSRNVPWLGRRALPFVRQVDAYLDRPHIRNAVDAIVGPTLQGGPSVVVAHSLGTIVSYSLLRSYGDQADVKLFVTLGSPLGIDIVKTRIKPPSLRVPGGVAAWVNGTDERDYVALYGKLDSTTFADGIENLTVQNGRDDPHSIWDYLSHERISRPIADALHA